jgi:hypothetical protein
MVYYCGKDDENLQARQGRSDVWMNIVYQLLYFCNSSISVDIKDDC